MAQLRRAVAIHDDSVGRDGRARERTGAGKRCHRCRRPAPRAATSSARRRRSLTGRPAIRQNGTTSPASRRRYASRTSCKALSTRPPGRSARASGCGRAGRHQVRASGDDAGLGSAEELVAAERDERGTGGQGLAGGRLSGQPGRRAARQPRAAGVEQAGADVGDDGGPSWPAASSAKAATDVSSTKPSTR